MDGSHQVELRPFPYPFRAALAICSDIDLCDRSLFMKIHEFLNGNLGLPVSDSFFGCGMGLAQLALLNDKGTGPGKDAEFIIQGLHAGLFDSIHTWADLNRKQVPGSALRRMAMRVVELLLGNDITVKVWINHGAPCNTQNLMSRLYPHYGGDVAESEYYSADLCRLLGIRYVCPEDIVTWPLSEHRIGRICGPVLQHLVRNCVKRMVGRSYAVRRAAGLTHLSVPTRLRDGGMMYTVSRYNPGPRKARHMPTRHTLQYSLGRNVLDRLVACGGYGVVYTHLGIPHPKGEQLFPPEEMKALRMLSKAYHEGVVWVCPTAKLLRYNTIRRGMKWRVLTDDDGETIEIIGCRNAGGDIVPMKPEDCSGISFITGSQQRTKLLLHGKLIRTDECEMPGLKRKHVSVPIDPAPTLFWS